jgi:hypothetical protein
MGSRLLQAALYAFLAVTSAAAQPSGTPPNQATAQLPLCSWKIENFGVARLLLPPISGRAASEEDLAERTVAQLQTEATDVQLAVDTRRLARVTGVSASSTRATVRVLVNGKVVHRSVLIEGQRRPNEAPGLVKIPVGDIFGGSSPRQPEAKSLEVEISFDGEEKGKPHKLFGCQLQGSADAVSALRKQQQHHQSEFDAQILTWSVGILVLGGMILVVVLVPDRRWQMNFGALIGFVAVSILEPMLIPKIPDPGHPFPDIRWIWLASLGLTAGAAGTVALSRILEYFSNFLAHLREVLVPSQWKLDTHAQVSQKDHVKRWFVAISSMTGAVIGSLYGLGELWKALGATIELRSILFGLLFVVVAMFLTGPIQAYVFDWSTGAKEPSEPSKRIADIFAAGDSRAIGRLIMVLVIFLALYLLTASVSGTVRQGKSHVLSLIIVAAVTPGVVSYYWSAALQRSAPSVLQTATGPSLYAGAVMVYGSALVLAFDLLLGDYMANPGKGNPGGPAALAVVPLSVLIALALSAVVTLPFAMAGGYVIDRLPGPHVMYYLGGTLFAVGIIVAVVLTPLAWLMGLGAATLRYSTFVGATVGWAIGLWASGFPRLVTGSRPAQ